MGHIYTETPRILEEIAQEIRGSKAKISLYLDESTDVLNCGYYRRNGEVMRASASQSVGLGLIP